MAGGGARREGAPCRAGGTLVAAVLLALLGAAGGELNAEVRAGPAGSGARGAGRGARGSGWAAVSPGEAAGPRGAVGPVPAR